MQIRQGRHLETKCIILCREIKCVTSEYEIFYSPVRSLPCWLLIWRWPYNLCVGPSLSSLQAIFMIPTNPPPTFRKPELWSDEFTDFVKKCLVKNPEQRATATQLLQVREQRGDSPTGPWYKKALMFSSSLSSSMFSTPSSARPSRSPSWGTW